MRLEQLIARRYLFSTKRYTFVTFISVISVVGVVVGVAALVVVLSVFNGFNGLVTSILVNFDPHVRVESYTRATPSAYDSLAAVLSSHPDVVGFAPFVSGKAMLISRNDMRVVNIRGIDDERIGAVSGLKDRIVLGRLDLSGEYAQGIVLGLSLADRIGAVVGDTIAVVSPAGAELALMQLGQPLVQRFRVAGIYESNNKEYDAYYAYIGLSAAQRLFQMGDDISGVELRLTHIDRAAKLKDELKRPFGTSMRILTWYDLHRNLYSMMRVERWMAYIILCLIIGVASFHLLGSLTMTVIEKTRDIGILTSMGTTAKQIVRIFVMQGLAVGIVGTLIGLGLGYAVVALQERFHLFPLDPTVYIIPAIPTNLQLLDVVLVGVTAIVFSTVASLYPARRAAHLIPAEAIRWE